jgi:site-specific DNA-methyltransferase (adenine-specific)
MVEDLLSVCLNAKIVYDPFMGSGTTALACINLGKQYIGSEIEKEYVDLSRKNIENKSIAI